jgi:hypothetical protein
MDLAVEVTHAAGRSGLALTRRFVVPGHTRPRGQVDRVREPKVSALI